MIIAFSKQTLSEPKSLPLIPPRIKPRDGQIFKLVFTRHNYDTNSQQPTLRDQSLLLLPLLASFADGQPPRVPAREDCCPSKFVGTDD